MDAMGSIILFIVFIIIFTIIIEVFTVLFRLTGLTHEKAKTQVISLLTNSGFTTSESEVILNSKKRRKLAQLTMMFGYSFTVIIVSVVVNIFFTLNRTEMKSVFSVVVVILPTLAILFMFMRLKTIRSGFDHFIEKIGNNIMFGKKSNPVVLIDVYNDMAMAEIFLEFIPPFLKETRMEDSRLKEDYDIQILLLKRSGEVGIMVAGGTVLCSGDIIVVFGNYKNIRTVFEHPESAETD